MIARIEYPESRLREIIRSVIALELQKAQNRIKADLQAQVDARSRVLSAEMITPVTELTVSRQWILDFAIFFSGCGLGTATTLFVLWWKL